MSFLGGAIASVRNHISNIGTSVGNGGLSRRHTISTAVTSASSPCPPLSGREPAGILKVEKPNIDRAGRTTVQDSASKALPTKRSRRKSVTFSSVDTITHLPTVSVSAASSQTRSSVQTRRNSSALPSGVSNRRVTNGHRDLPRTRRYTVSGPPVLPRLPTQAPEHAPYSSLDREKRNHDSHLHPSPESTQHHPRSRRHTTLASPSDYHALDNRRGYELPSEYIALGYQGSFPSLGGSWYDLPSTSWAGATAFLPGDTILFGQPYSSFAVDSLPYGVYNNPYEYPAQGYGIEGYHPPHYSIYRVDSPPVVISPTTYFFAPPSRSYPEHPITHSSDRVEYTILPLSSRFSPTHAQHSSSYTECLALLDTRSASLVPSHFPPPKCVVQGTEKILILHARNKKGLGMFAQKPLRTGEVILSEVPTLIVPSDVPNFSGPAEDASTDMYEKMFDLLSDGVKRELMDLAWHGNCRGDVNVYETIMRLNPLAVSLPLSSAPGCSTASVSSIHRGTFLKTSRCNHSCGPNAQWRFHPSSLTLLLTCLRPISMGDEITITYNSPYLPFFHRRADLKNLFGFECTCDSCFRILSQPQENIRSRLIEESDSARNFLTTFWDSYPSFEAWSQNPSAYPEANLLISAHKVALEMIEREGLEELSSIQYSRPEWYAPDPSLLQPLFGPVPVPDTIRHTDGIAMCYGVLSDVANFRKWVARAMDARLSHSGSGTAVAHCWGAFEDILKWNGKSCHQIEDQARFGDAQCQTENIRKILERWMASPETFPAWGLRG